MKLAVIDSGMLRNNYSVSGLNGETNGERYILRFHTKIKLRIDFKS